MAVADTLFQLCIFNGFVYIFYDALSYVCQRCQRHALKRSVYFLLSVVFVLASNWDESTALQDECLKEYIASNKTSTRAAGSDPDKLMQAFLVRRDFFLPCRIFANTLPLLERIGHAFQFVDKISLFSPIAPDRETFICCAVCVWCDVAHGHSEYVSGTVVNLTHSTCTA